MDIQRMIETLKAHPHLGEAGMIASHLGIVRGHSLDGRPVKAIEIRYLKEKLEEILSETRALEGIVDVTVEVREGVLTQGEDVMAVLVAGDTREHVFPALVTMVDRIKKEAAQKKEIF